ncbi:MAG TPA: hypothetical protein VJP89_01230 [Pyrinomonadaceae bacterium]|nr:hypothetical protein [Pyrinomonadaceae bacterium]
MMIKSFRFAGFVILALFTTLQAASMLQPAVAKGAVELKPCKPEGIEGDAKCGTLEVFENRATQKGRKIKINILVLPASGPQREPDALFYFAGGPGSGATEDASGIAKVLASMRQRRDLVFVDQRGTGQSNPLNCELFNSADPQSYLGSFFHSTTCASAANNSSPKRISRSTPPTSRWTISTTCAPHSVTNRSISTEAPTARARRSSTCDVIQSTCAP